MLAMICPYFDRAPDNTVGVWLPASRTRRNVIFLVILALIIGLSFVGLVLRGPNWEIFMPWQAWPHHPTLI
jgi:hypothetical protein